MKLMRITIREDFSMTMVDAVLEELEKAVEWLDHHFTMDIDKVTQFANRVLNRKFSRFDSKIMRELTGDLSADQQIKPC